MSININDACIIIASHISNPKRIGHLFECLHSLLNQTIPVPIYLSISFESDELKQAFALLYSEEQHFQTPVLTIIVKTEKTPQMRHIEQLLPLIESKHKWIMFCDDDDTYATNRAEMFLQTIVNSIEQVSKMPDKKFIGVYESTFGKNHQEQRHEFWCYCVYLPILQAFMDGVRPHADILDNKCCDVFFGEYLRRINPNYLYASITTPLYNYRVDDNSDSITGVIRNTHKLIRQAREITPENMEECAKELNDYLNKEFEIYKHDTYLRAIIGNDFETVLQKEFKEEVCILHMIDRTHIVKLLDFYNRLHDICNAIYYIKV